MKFDSIAQAFRALRGLPPDPAQPSAAVLAHALMDTQTNQPAAFVAGGVLDIPLVQNVQTADYTLVLTDAGKYVRMNKSTSVNLTVPPNSAAAIPVGSQILLDAMGAGQVTVAQGAGVTVNSSQTLLLRAQHSHATLIKVGVDEWNLVGDLQAA